MSFNYLPLPLFLLMMLSVAIVMFFYTSKWWNTEPKPTVIGSLLLGATGIGTGLTRVGEEILLFGDNLWIIKLLTLLFGSIGTVLLIIGSYKKAKDDPQRKKTILILSGILVILMLFMGLLIAYAYFKL